MKWSMFVGALVMSACLCATQQSYGFDLLDAMLGCGCEAKCGCEQQHPSGLGGARVPREYELDQSRHGDPECRHQGDRNDARSDDVAPQRGVGLRNLAVLEVTSLLG